MENEYSAERALHDASSSREALALRLRPPAGYHAARALVIALCVGTLGVQHQRHLPLRLSLMALGVIGIAGLFAWYSRSTGVSVREGAGGWWRFAWLAIVFVGANAERYLAVDRDRWGLVSLVALLTGGLCWALAVREDQVVRRRVASGEKLTPQP